jgi:hypothetical protein
MTVHDLVSIVGPAAEPCEVTQLRAADKAAAQHLKRSGGALLDQDSKHHDIWNALIAHADWSGAKDPADRAANRADACATGAYYFGLALGLRLSGGGR